jgi:hypothetical protein
MIPWLVHFYSIRTCSCHRILYSFFETKNFKLGACHYCIHDRKGYVQTSVEALLFAVSAPFLLLGSCEHGNETLGFIKVRDLTA